MTDTPAPTDTPTPTATLTPSPEPTLEPSPTSEPPSPTPRPAASVPQPTSPPPAVAPTTAPPPAAGPVTLSFVARNISYNVSEVRVRSGATVTVTFRNEDAGVDHDVSFGIAGLGHGHTCTGSCSDQYSFTAPAPGTYAFFCTVHAAMQGTLIVDP